MRIESENGIISMMRGDTVVIPAYINEGTKLQPSYRPLIGNEKLYFALMEPGQPFEDAVLKKVFDSCSPTDEDGNIIIRIESTETQRLLCGTYYYTIKLRTPQQGFEDTVTTIVNPTLFYIHGNNNMSDKIDYTDVTIDNGPETIVFDGGDISVRK